MLDIEKIEKKLKNIMVFIMSCCISLVGVFIMVAYVANPDQFHIPNASASSSEQNLTGNENSPNTKTVEDVTVDETLSEHDNESKTEITVEEHKPNESTVQLTENQIEILIEESKNLYESVNSIVNKEDKIYALKATIEICDSILESDAENFLILKRKMQSNLDLTSLHTTKSDLFTYYDEAQKSAKRASSIDYTPKENMNILYYYGQALYEKGNNAPELKISTSCYVDAIKVFRQVKSYDDYWTNHYILSCTDRLYLLTNDINYLNQIEQDVEEIHITSYNEFYQKKMSRMLADYYFRLGKFKFMNRDKDFKSNLDKAEFYIKFGLELNHDTEYFEGLLSVISEIQI